MIEVVDLDIDAHKAKCARCRLFALCEEGRRLVKQQGTELIANAAQFGKPKRT